MRCARRSAPPSDSGSRRSSTLATPGRSCATGPSARTSWSPTSSRTVRRPGGCARSSLVPGMAVDYDQIKQAQRAMWSAGDYPDIATHIESAAEELVALSDVQPGHEVLDVATGSGNCALVAA